MNAQEARVLVAVVVGSRVVHPVVPVETWGHLEGGGMVQRPSTGPVALGTASGRCHPPVEHIEVEPGEHALARPAGRERAAATHHHVQHSEGDEVCLLQEPENRAQLRGQAWARGARWEPVGTYQEGAALQPYHDVCELGKRGRAQADLGHVSFQL